jgi:signal transduction histidine kinase
VLRVAVEDRGAGIAPEDFPKLFQKFSRLTQPVGTQRTRGTGLGLYSCRLMVEAQGGRIWADSSPGGGSTFSYTMPIARKGAP